jgi:hypothetical protein
MVNAGGALVAASYDNSSGRWVATVPSGVSARVPAGGVQDAFGETNGADVPLG